jgi:integrase
VGQCAGGTPHGGVNMAYVRFRSGRWYYTLVDHRGRKREIVTTARTKTEAVRVAAERERTAERIRLGLEEAPPADLTFRDLAQIWRDTDGARKRSTESVECRLRVHLLPAFGDDLLGDITAERIERFLNEKAKKLSVWSVEHLRRLIRALFNCARTYKRFRGENPASQVRPRRIPQRQVAFLEANEIPRLLAQLDADRWRPLFATAVYAGLRKGELAGLLWSDVDLNRRLITVARSYDAESTKTGKVRILPICDELVPHLLGIARRGPLVFPMTDGTMMPKNIKLVPILSRALKRAEIVLGYNLVCRRKGCGHSERRQQNAEVRCPKCNMRLWAKVIPKHIRFQDLRTTFATHLHERTGDIQLVQKMLGHSSPTITASTYSGIRDDYARAAVNTLRFTITAEITTGVVGIRSANDRYDAERPFDPAVQLPRGTAEIAARAVGVEPTTFGSGGQRSIQLS